MRCCVRDVAIFYEKKNESSAREKFAKCARSSILCVSANPGSTAIGRRAKILADPLVDQ